MIRINNMICLAVAALMTTLHAGQEVHVRAVHHAKIPLAICIDDAGPAELQEMATIMQADCSFSEQFAVSVVPVTHSDLVKKIGDVGKQGCCLAIYLTAHKNDKGIEWRVYDTGTQSVVAKKMYSKRGASLRGWAHNMTDSIWPVLTGEQGFFSSKIAYCKDVKIKGKKTCKYICMADYDGSHEQVIVSTPTINVAPRFNKDRGNPLLFYSESTNKNIRLMNVDMQKRRKIASNFDGINMVPSFSEDGTQVVYCASQGVGNCQIYYFKKGVFKQLTRNKGNNVSPILNGDGSSLFYCSDAEHGVPQLYCYSMADKTQTQLTNNASGSYCPTYCEKTKKLAYCKKVGGIMQVFVYDENRKVHEQLTFDKSHKDECVWSPCGNYLLYGRELGSSQQIASLNVLTGNERLLTPKDAVCSYPTWSPLYAQYPELA